MGKEAKIGLAIVGVLMLVFAALLVRRFLPFEAMMADTSAPAGKRGRGPQRWRRQAASPDGTTRLAPYAQGEQSATAGRRGHQRPAESPADMPRREFMPRDSATAGGEPRDRYRQDEPPAAGADDVPSADSDPFDREIARRNEQPGSAEPRELEVTPPDASALEDRQGRTQRSPLRRLNAELTADELPAAAEPSSTEGAEPDLSTIEVPSSNDDSVAPPLETESAAPVDKSTRPGSRYQEPAEGPLEEPRPLVDNGKYTIQPNDSLWLISEKVYGNGRYFKAIYQHNRNKLPRADQLTVGTVIAVPPANVLEENYPALCPKQRKSVMVQPRAVQASTRPPVARGGDVYVVEAGDTLFDIARYELGKASRWSEIYDLNREKLGEDFDFLQPGTELRMPPRSGRGDAVTRRPDAAYQR